MTDRKRIVSSNAIGLLGTLPSASSERAILAALLSRLVTELAKIGEHPGPWFLDVDGTVWSAEPEELVKASDA